MTTKDFKLFTLTKDEVITANVSTAFSGYVEATYSELIEVLGEPTYNLSDVLDKTNFEWFVLFEGRIFSIYDWKCTASYSLQERTKWHLGAQWRQAQGLLPAEDFINEINERIANVRNENVFSNKKIGS
jgi:hypothetical protein